MTKDTKPKDSAIPKWVSDWEDGHFSAHLELVRLGVRTAAEVTVHNECAPECLAKVKKERLFAHTEAMGATHTSITIFAHKHLATIIPMLSTLPEPLLSWAYGKLYGYSEAKIGEFLDTLVKGHETLPKKKD